MTMNQLKNRNYVIIARLQSETKGKLINRIPGLRHLTSSLPGFASRMLVECQQAFSKPCLVNFISKDTHPVFSIYELPEGQGSDHWVDIVQVAGERQISQVIQALAQKAVHEP